jgi:uncharacterized Zn finger protein (UPF0148 family)
MHTVACPSCGLTVKVDFQPVAGLVFCPTCQKLFSPPAVSVPDSEKAQPIKVSDKRDGNAG